MATTQNELYNGNFIYARRSGPTFPDGWSPVGGTPDTRWIWEGAPPGPREVKIQNQTTVLAGIRQEQSVFIPAGERQRWLMQLGLRASKPEKRAYVKVCFTTPEGYPIGLLELYYILTEQKAIHQDVVVTPIGTSAITLEIGITDSDSIWISDVSFTRLYPLKILRLDAKGRVFVNHVQTVEEIRKPIRIQDPVNVNVNAKVDADIRSLAYWRDSIKVFGSEGLPLKTDSEGKALVSSIKSYTGAKETTFTTDNWTSSMARDVSVQTAYTFAVLNAGDKDALLQVSVSPDNLCWITDGATISLKPGDMEVLVPKYFLRYTCISFKSASGGNPTLLTIWYQAQG